MSAAGLSITADAIRVIRFASRDGSLKVAAFGERKLAPGAVVEGKIVDAAEVGRALSECRQTYDLRFVRTTISDEKVYLFKIRLPLMRPEEIRSALEFKIEENVPVSLADAVFDYSVLSDEGSSELDIAVAVTHIKSVSAYVDALRAAGLKPVSVLPESQAIADAVVAKGDKQPTLIVCFEPERTGLYIVEQGVVGFSLTLPDEGSAAASTPAGQGGSEKLYSPKYRRLDTVCAEAERIVSYWKSRPGNAAADVRYVVCGSEALDHEFMEHFSGLAKKELVAGNVWANVFAGQAGVPPIPQEAAFTYAPAIGAGLSDHLQGI